MNQTHSTAQKLLASCARPGVALAACVPIIFFAVVAWQHRWLGDDGFINLRIARHVLASDGVVYNIGERVEAFTSPLWLLILVVLGALRIPLEHAALFAGYVLSIAGLVLALVGGARLATGGPLSLDSMSRHCVVPLGVMVYAALPAAWDYATSGLETGLCIAWLGAVFWLLVRRADDSTSIPSELVPRANRTRLAVAFLLGLGPLVRPELSLFSVALSLPLAMELAPALRGARIRQLLGLVACVAAPPLAYQLFRMGYYATMVANTALAKEAFAARWDQGWLFFRNFFGLYELLLPLSLLLIPWATPVRHAWDARWFRKLALLLLPPLCGISYTLYVVRLGGCFMHGRLFLPGVFCFLLPVACVALRLPHNHPRVPLARALVATMLVAWSVVVIGWIRVSPTNEHGIGDERGWYSRTAQEQNPVRIDDYEKFPFHRDASHLLSVASQSCPRMDGRDPSCTRTVLVDEFVAPGRRTRFDLDPASVPDRVVMVTLRGAMGIYGYKLPAEVHLVDRHGLADPVAARLQVVARGRPGHEKVLDDAWVIARFSKPTVRDDPRLVAARDALRCGDVAELLRAIQEPMTVRRFIANLGVAWRLRDLRMAPTPEIARRELCVTR